MLYSIKIYIIIIYAYKFNCFTVSNYGKIIGILQDSTLDYKNDNIMSTFENRFSESSKMQHTLANPKAAAHVTVDLWCWSRKL